MIVHQLGDQGQAQARSVRLVGDKGIEQVGPDILRHARTIVMHGNFDRQLHAALTAGHGQAQAMTESGTEGDLAALGGRRRGGGGAGAGRRSTLRSVTGAVVAGQGVADAGAGRALVGENGAGNSPALKRMSGHLEPGAGRVLVAGEPLSPHSPQEAFARGIGMVHQHFMLVDTFTALENLVLGSEPVVAGLLDRAHWTPAEVDTVIPHQASMRGVMAMDRGGFSEKQVINIVGKYGNTIAASIPMAMATADREGRLKRGDKVIVVGMGAGLHIAGAVLRW
mgnify:CR=1 FL=1